MLEKILSFNPWCEVFIKWLYWRSTGIRNLLKPTIKKMRRSNSPMRGEKNFNDLKKILMRMNISSNDILMIHSSFTDLKLADNTPEELLEFLLKSIVPDGTLVMPAMPIMKSLSGKVLEYPGDPNEVAVFDLEKSIPWTGVLPRKLMKYKGARRWWNPINNVVAYGLHAEEMMSNGFFDKDVEGIYPSDKESPWGYMFNKNVKILSLGTDLVHSLTMIHYAEDIKGELWPINGWYRKRNFLIISNGKKVPLRLNERDPKWAINFAERTLRKRLLSLKLMISINFNGSNIEFLESSKLIQHLEDNNINGYPYFTLKHKS
jgi:aminoglycoside 3-N-acetyltransferase